MAQSLKIIACLVDAIELATGELKSFDYAACDFGYRESVFKRAIKDQFLFIKSI
jgi:UDP-N-acetylmuramate dehydrogenase